MVAVWRSGRVEIFNKEFLPETRRDGGAEPQSLVSIPNTSEINPNYLPSGCDLKVCVVWTAIRPTEGTLRLAAPLVLFRKEQANAVTGFSINLSSPHIHHSYIISHLLHTLILDTFSTLQLHIILQCSSQWWCYSFQTLLAFLLLSKNLFTKNINNNNKK